MQTLKVRVAWELSGRAWGRQQSGCPEDPHCILKMLRNDLERGGWEKAGGTLRRVSWGSKGMEVCTEGKLAPESDGTGEQTEAAPCNESMYTGPVLAVVQVPLSELLSRHRDVGRPPPRLLRPRATLRRAWTQCPANSRAGVGAWVAGSGAECFLPPRM